MMRWATVLLVLAATFFITGCGEGMALSSHERRERIDRVIEVDARQLTDDLDLFFLNDDISHLTPWRTRSWP